MAEDKKVIRNVVLNENEYKIVKELQSALGLGDRGFSASLRIIIREWYDFLKGKEIQGGGQPPVRMSWVYVGDRKDDLEDPDVLIVGNTHGGKE